MLIANEDFSDIKKVDIIDYQKDQQCGFSAFKFLPGYFI